MDMKPERARDLHEISHLVGDRARSLESLCSSLSTASQCIEKYKSKTKCWGTQKGNRTRRIGRDQEGFMEEVSPGQIQIALQFCK